MTYSDFKQRVVSFFYENLGSDAKITIYPVQKNNNVQLDGLTVLENESNISPTLYLNYYYNQLQNQTPLSKILSQMLRTYLSTKSDTTIDTSRIIKRSAPTSPTNLSAPLSTKTFCTTFLINLFWISQLYFIACSQIPQTKTPPSRFETRILRSGIRTLKRSAVRRL